MVGLTEHSIASSLNGFIIKCKWVPDTPLPTFEREGSPRWATVENSLSFHYFVAFRVARFPIWGEALFKVDEAYIGCRANFIIGASYIITT